MQIKNKKTFLEIIILAAITFAFISFFAPFNCIDYSDVLEKNGYKNPDLYWKQERSLLSTHHIEYDYRNSENPQEYHRYTFFNILKFERGETTGEFSNVNDYDILSDNNKNPPISYSIFNMAGLIVNSLSFSFFVYISYKIIKIKPYKTDKYILYNIIILLIILSTMITGAIYINNVKDVNNLGYMDSWTLGYGFYLMFGSIILFLSSYFIKRYIFEFKEKTQDQ
jgi:hypothetical protein